MTFNMNVRLRVIALALIFMETGGPAVTQKVLREMIQAQILEDMDIFISDRTLRRIVKEGKENVNPKRKLNECAGRTCIVSDEVLLQWARDLIESGTVCSTRKLAHAMGVSVMTCYRILRNSLQKYAYRRGRGQELKETMKQIRLEACKTLLRMRKNEPEKADIIWFSDEAYVTMNPHVNRKNDIQWRNKGDLPPVTETHNAHPAKLCFYAMVRKGCRPIVYVFEKENVCSANYVRMMDEHCIPLIKEMRKNPSYGAQRPASNLLDPEHDYTDYTSRENDRTLDIFMQDGAPAHTAIKTLEFLAKHFAEIITLKATPKTKTFNGETYTETLIWPPHSPDLNPLDFWLWGYLKSQVWIGERPKNLAELKAKVIDVIDNIPQDMIDRACDKFWKNVELCVNANGSHFDKHGKVPLNQTFDTETEE